MRKKQIIFFLHNALSDYLVKKKLSLGKTFVRKRKPIFKERNFKRNGINILLEEVLVAMNKGFLSGKNYVNLNYKKIKGELDID